MSRPLQLPLTPGLTQMLSDAFGGAAGDPDRCGCETLPPRGKLRGGTVTRNHMVQGQGLDHSARSCSGQRAAYLSETSFSRQGGEQC